MNATATFWATIIAGASVIGTVVVAAVKIGRLFERMEQAAPTAVRAAVEALHDKLKEHEFGELEKRLERVEKRREDGDSRLESRLEAAVQRLEALVEGRAPGGP